MASSTPVCWPSALLMRTPPARIGDPAVRLRVLVSDPGLLLGLRMSEEDVVESWDDYFGSLASPLRESPRVVGTMSAYARTVRVVTRTPRDNALSPATAGRLAIKSLASASRLSSSIWPTTPASGVL